MAEVNAYWAALSTRWEEIRGSRKRTALIQKIVEPPRKADPGQVPFGDDVHIHVGANTYQGKDGAPAAAPLKSEGEAATRLSFSYGNCIVELPLCFALRNKAYAADHALRLRDVVASEAEIAEELGLEQKTVQSLLEAADYWHPRLG